MRLFRKVKKSSGWLAIFPQAEGIYAAHVLREGTAKPKVELAAFFALEGKDEKATLELLGKELHAERFACTTVLGSGDYQILSVDAPNVPPDELRTAIRWRLKDMLDYHIDDATIDVLDVPVDKNAPSRNHSMFAIAARNQIIQSRQALFDAAGVPLSVIDIPEMGQRNVSALLEEEGRGVACLSFDESGGLLTVTYSGELYLSRRIEVSFAQLQSTDTDQLNARYDRITLELQRSLDHFDRQYHFITVAKLMLAPLGDASAGLQAYLSSNLYIPVETLNLESILDLSSVPDLKMNAMQQRFFTVIGCALRHEEKAL